ncbi:MAG: type I restriction enzyme HsdR N-terminal domain-containing protein [Bacteroidales bacterium]|nr:type I restriction enzyme HsdR N-terminal domain-containing protein [Bacteroidales bacterium]MCB8999745.1 type I restriction enzyme HsdR N-terminal domain-containing protein [Bacteroidales bacterium]MCB9013445.1 type I restriction enzyme HsdR N-terminal domain-containing protein [Bacteroidales bacterium]
MKALNLPTYSFKIKSENELDYIYDPFRRKYFRLTPEEWVRQNFASYLVNEKQYPTSRIVLEKSLRVNKLFKRCDILIAGDQGKPIMIVECKAPEVKIGQNTFEQVSVYNLAFKVEYLVITNGMQHFCCKIDFTNNSVNFINEIPEYGAIRQSDSD